MTLLKGSPAEHTKAHVFGHQRHHIAHEPVIGPIEAKAAIGAAPIKDKSLAKEEHFLDQIAQLERALDKSENAIEEAKKIAYKEGAEAGQKAAAMNSEETLKLLRVSLAEGLQKLEDELKEQVNLNLDLARTICRRVIGDNHNFPDHVLSVVQHWKKQLAAETILRVRVSASDFAEQSALDQLQSALANVEIEPCLELESGCCLFDLKLGTLDASLGKQLENADSWLTSAAKSGDVE